MPSVLAAGSRPLRELRPAAPASLALALCCRPDLLALLSWPFPFGSPFPACSLQLRPFSQPRLSLSRGSCREAAEPFPDRGFLLTLARFYPCSSCFSRLSLQCYPDVQLNILTRDDSQTRSLSNLNQSSAAHF